MKIHFPRWVDWAFVFIGLVCLFLSLTGCGEAPERPVIAPVAPSSENAKDLHAKAEAAAIAAAVAKAKNDETEFRIQTAIAATAGKLATDADARTAKEQAQIDERVKAATDEAQQRQDAKDRAASDTRFRFWAGIGVGLSVIAGVGLFMAGVPSKWASVIPIAVGSGCAVLVAWPTIANGVNEIVKWAMIAVGGCLALGFVALLFLVIRTLFREWGHYAATVQSIDPLVKLRVDADSLTRQSAPVKWFINLLHQK